MVLVINYPVILITAVLLLLLIIVIIIIVCYKKCPLNKILVIYGKVGRNSNGSMRTHKYITKGSVLVWPFYQKYKYLDLKPKEIIVDLGKHIKDRYFKYNMKLKISFTFSRKDYNLDLSVPLFLGLSEEEIIQKCSNSIIEEFNLRTLKDHYYSYDICYLAFRSATDEVLAKFGMNTISYIDINQSLS